MHRVFLLVEVFHSWFFWFKVDAYVYVRMNSSRSLTSYDRALKKANGDECRQWWAARALPPLFWRWAREHSRKPLTGDFICIENGQSALGLLFHIVALVPQALCRCQLFEKLSYCSRSQRWHVFCTKLPRPAEWAQYSFNQKLYELLILYNGFYWAALAALFLWELRGTWNVWLWDQNHGAQL